MSCTTAYDAQYDILSSSTSYSSFSGEPSPGSSIRYVETQSMQIGASYSLQFSLVMGCGREPSPHIDTQVRLEFSTNHGLTWHLVKEVRRSLFKWRYRAKILLVKVKVAHIDSTWLKVFRYVILNAHTCMYCILRGWAISLADYQIQHSAFFFFFFVNLIADKIH